MKSQVTDPAARKAALFIATLTGFLWPFMGASINVALPSIGKELMMDAISLAWVATGYLLASATFLVPFGRISDIYGRRRVFLSGISLYTISALVCALSNSGWLLIAFRVLQGIASAMTYGSAVAILISVFPPGERGKVLAINVATIYVGLSLGPTLGGLLTQQFGWRSIFLFSVAICATIITATIWKLKGEWAEAKGEKFDLTGSAVFCLAMVAIMYGFSELPATSAEWLIFGGILGLVAFVWWEARAKSPVMDISLFRHNAVFAFSNLAALINYAATAASGFLLSLYLQCLKELTPMQAGLILISQPLVMPILSPVVGRLSDKVEPQILASAGMAASAIGLAMFGFLSEDTGLGLILGGLVITGLGLTLFVSPNMNAVLGSVEKKSYGVATGMLGTMRALGQMLSLGIVMMLFSLYVGRVQITPEYYPLFLTATRTAFFIFAALCFGGIFASIARGKTRNAAEIKSVSLLPK